jgi:hypothetical protein
MSTGRRFRFIREAGRPARQASRILNRRLSRHHVLFEKLHDRLAAVQLPGLDAGDDKDVDRGIGLLHRQRPEVTKFEAEFFRKIPDPINIHKVIDPRPPLEPDLDSLRHAET